MAGPDTKFEVAGVTALGNVMGAPGAIDKLGISAQAAAPAPQAPRPALDIGGIGGMK